MSERSGAEQGKAPKILVVDDEPDLEDLLRRRMRREVRDGRYDFVFARDGNEALERLREDRGIKLVLSDINMPGMDGLTLLDQIPRVDPNVRAIVVSAYDDMRNIRTAMNRGAFDFVTKPIDFRDLKSTIDKTLSHLNDVREALETRDRLVALESELNVAGRIQQSIMPTMYWNIPGCQVFGSLSPAREVGGDFFDVVRLEGGRIGLAIGDVSGKGVPAAMYMMSSRALVQGLASRTPAEVLSVVNRLLEEDNEAGMFVTLFYAVLHPATGSLRYANGGHRPPLIVHPDGSSMFLPGTGGLALGAVPRFAYAEDEATLAPGDLAVLYTDGVTEARNAADEKFGYARLQAVFAEGRTDDAREVSEAIVDAVRAFSAGAPQVDDIACLAVLRES